MLVSSAGIRFHHYPLCWLPTIYLAAGDLEKPHAAAFKQAAASQQQAAAAL
jgi:hypothetical protein